MADIHKLIIVIDRDRDLAPQVIVYRQMGVPWKFLEDLSGRRRNRLEELVERFHKQAQARAISPGLGV